MDWKTFDYRILIDYERIKDFTLHGRMPNPRFAIMYLTSFCNLKCKYCEYAQENLGGFMPTKRVLQTIDELKALGVEAIEFCGGGEPLLHPDLEEILNYCKESNIVVGILTNFTPGNKNLLETIVQTCSYLRVSMDTFDRNEYEELKGVALLSQVKKNLKKLVRLKKKNKSNINIGIKMLLTTLNYGGIKDFIKGGIKLGVDNIQFKKVYSCPELELNDEEVKAIEVNLKRYKTIYKDKVNIFYGFYGLELKKKCFTSINHIFIDAFGDIYLCCHYLDRRKEHRLGNIYDKSVKDIWFSKRHFEVIYNTDRHVCNKTDCRWIKYNNFMLPIIKDKERSLDFI